MADQSERDPQVFGEICTGDHQNDKRINDVGGLAGIKYAFNQLDLATKSKSCTPVKSLKTDETHAAITRFKGDQQIQLYYSDNYESIKRAVYKQNIAHEFSQPGIHQTNAIIERCNQDINNGIRCYLMQAGLPGCF